MIGNTIKVCEVTVYGPVRGVSLNTNKKVTWTTLDGKVATVDNTGLVTAVSFGTADIIVTTEDQNRQAVCKITIKPIAVTGVSLNNRSLTMKTGETFQLKTKISPDNAANQKMTWNSSNPLVVSVDNGLGMRL